MEIYSQSFYNEIDEYLETIEQKFKDLPNLPIEKYKEQETIVENFIKDNKLKIYGGVALDKFMPDDDKIYANREGKIVDYDFYSPSPRKHAVDLANKLFEAGFEYVQVKEGVNMGVYKVFNYFQECADIVFIPQKVYEMVPTKTFGGLDYVAPVHLKIDLLVALTNPKQGLFRWKKDFERLKKLEKYYPVERPKSFCQTSSQPYNPTYLDDKIQEFIFKRDDFILFGDMAYYAYMKESGLKDYYEPVIKTIEIGMNNPSSIFGSLKKITGNKIKIRRFHQFQKHIPTRYMVTPKGKDNNIMLIIYELNEKCIPYLNYDGDKIMTYHSLILYYNFMRYLSKLYNIKEKEHVAECCLYDLERAKTYYFNKSGQNEFGDNVFQNFVIPCIGEEKNVVRENKIKGWSFVRKFNYIPAKREHLVTGNKTGPGIVKFVSGEFDKEV